MTALFNSIMSAARAAYQLSHNDDIKGTIKELNGAQLA